MISVIIPVYNSEKYVGACIESVLKQDYRDFELILVNDGSTDKSISVCNYYAQQDTRIRVFDQPNQGVSHSRNMGIKKANGEFLTFVDSDDLIEQSYLLKMINLLVIV